MLSRKNLYRALLLALLLAMLAVPVFAAVVDGTGTAYNEGAATGELYFSEAGAESTGGPTAIADTQCNGGSGGSCGGG